MKCFACGKAAQSRLDSGEYICRDCVNSVGGYKHWFEIKALPPEQILYMLGGDGETDKPDSLKAALKNTKRSLGTVPPQPQTVVVKKRGGCLAALGWMIVILIVVGVLVALLAEGFSKIPENGDVAKATEAPVLSGELDDRTTVEDLFSDSDLKMLKSLGLTEIHMTNIITNGTHEVFFAQIFDDKDMQLNITTENGDIIYVELTGVTKDKLTMNSKWNGKSSVPMYSDTEGGKLAELNWLKKRLSVL